MRDLIRFVWRGALGGAIIPLTWYGYYLIIAWRVPFIRYYLLVSLCITAIPGALVGMVLWLLCFLFVDRLGTFLRIIIGVAIALTIITLPGIPRSQSPLDEPSESLRLIVWILIYGVAVGGLAGWLCPPTMIFRREPEPPYWERVREYEAAQAEREYWIAQRNSGKSPEGKHSA